MKKKNILVTCPPMIGVKDFFIQEFNKRNWMPIIPKFTQTVEETKLCQLLPKCHGWIIGDDKVTEKILLAGKSGLFKAAVKWGVGTDNINYKLFKRLNIPISNTPNVFGIEVAEVALCYLLGQSRYLFSINEKVKKGIWIKPRGESIKNSTIGIVGFGDIGSNLYKLLKPFSVDVIAWDPLYLNKSVSKYKDVDFQKWPYKLKKCDYIILTCPLNAKTKNIINPGLKDRFKNQVGIINVSRGELIDENFLYKMLKNEDFKFAALEVLKDEPISKKNKLLKLQNIIFGSHNASNSSGAVIQATRKAILKLDNFFKSN